MFDSWPLNCLRKRNISKAAYGDHNMIIYNDLNEFREIYSFHSKKGLEENNEIVLISSTYETPDRVQSNLTSAGVDVRKHLSEGSLMIIDSMRAYRPDVMGLVKLVESLHTRGQKNGKSGVVCFGDVGSFFLLDKTRELTDYETTIPKKLHYKLRAFCCYHKENFDELTNDQKQKLLKGHFRVV
jgi:KaiC/GvpD/RAD55 family RecA-like ATPase